MLTAEQIHNERLRRGYPAAAHVLTTGVAGGHLLGEAATQRAIKLLMLGSHAHRCGELPRDHILGDD